MKKIAVDALKAHVEEEKVEKEKGLLQEIASIVSSSASSGNSNATVQSITRLLKENGKSGN
jgi:uncharacterized protein (UPF0335 family)